MPAETDDRPAIVPPPNEYTTDTQSREYTPEEENELDLELYRSTLEDEAAGRYWFNSENYATDEEAMAALSAMIHSIGEEARRNAASDPPLDASR